VSEHELSEFDELSELLRRGPSDVAEETPKPTLWAAIEAAAVDEVTTARASRDRRRRLGAVAGVMAVAAMFLIAVPLGLSRYRSTPAPPMTAQLTALANFNGSGRAQLHGRTLEVDVSGLEPISNEFYELWLLDIENGQLHDLVPLGAIGGNAEFRLTDKVDLAKYSVVDISREPDDGDPAHSGDSVLRGQLEGA
jgi:anti-sigma-K factor RskA